MKQKENKCKLWQAIHMRVGLALLGAVISWGTEAEALSLEVKKTASGAAYLLATKEINEGDDAILEGVLESEVDITLVAFDSPGGSVEAAQEIGETIRSAGLNTMVAPQGECLSSCLLAFIGGLERHVPDTGKLGSHQFYWQPGDAPKDAVSISQSTSASLLRYFLKMGVDPEALVHIMETRPEGMLLFSADGLESFNLATTRPASKKLWSDKIVPDFIRKHPQYAAGSALYDKLDREVRRIQAENQNPFDPTILEDAHRALRDNGTYTRQE